MRIRTAVGDDVSGIVWVERACAEAPQWGETVWERLVQEGIAGEGLRCVLVAAEGVGIVGVVATGGFGEVAEIESLAVALAHRGQGIGKALCAEALRQVAERGARSVELEVRASNAAARGLYAGLGFMEQGLRKGYYQGPVEDAVLMSATLTAGESRKLQERKV